MNFDPEYNMSHSISFKEESVYPLPLYIYSIHTWNQSVTATFDQWADPWSTKARQGNLCSKADNASPVLALHIGFMLLPHNCHVVVTTVPSHVSGVTKYYRARLLPQTMCVKPFVSRDRITAILLTTVDCWESSSPEGRISKARKIPKTNVKSQKPQ